MARLIPLFAVASALALLAAWMVIGPEPAPPDAQEVSNTAEEIARKTVTGEFTLVDHRGIAVSDTDFRGAWLLTFFGYTHCPDVCPTTLATVAQVMDELGPAGAAVQPLFISVDPARDTPARLAEYVAAFHPRLIGLTGSEQQVAAAAASHRAYYQKVPLYEGEKLRDDEYAMDHSALVYLFDPQGVYATSFSPTDTTGKMVAEIRRRLAAAE